MVSKQDRLDALRKRLASQDVGGGGDFMSLKQGRNQVRILPEVGEMEAFYQPVGRHYFPDGKRVYCPKFTSDQELDCPICEFVSGLFRAGDPEAKKMANKLRVSRRFWMNVIDRSDEDRGVRILDAGITIFNAIVSIIGDPEFGDVTDVDDGADIKIHRTGTGMQTEYETSGGRDDSPLSTDEDTIDKWLEDAKELSWTQLSDDPSEDKELSAGYAVFVMPYDRIISEHDLDAILDCDPDDAEEDEPAPRRRDKRAVEADDDEEDEVKQEVKRRSARRRRRR